MKSVMDKYENVVYDDLYLCPSKAFLDPFLHLFIYTTTHISFVKLLNLHCMYFHSRCCFVKKKNAEAETPRGVFQSQNKISDFNAGRADGLARPVVGPRRGLQRV